MIVWRQESSGIFHLRVYGSLSPYGRREGGRERRGGVIEWEREGGSQEGKRKEDWWCRQVATQTGS